MIKTPLHDASRYLEAAHRGRPAHPDKRLSVAEYEWGKTRPFQSKKEVAHRATSMKYKEKFNAMRQRYEQVTARHEDYQRQLETANGKMKKLQAENDLLLDVISSGTVNIYPYPPPVEPPQLNFHQALLPYPNPPQPYSGRPHENFPSSYPHGQPPPPPPPPQPNHRHHHPHPRPHVHPDPHPHAHHRSPLLIQVNGGGSGSGPPGPGTAPGSGGGARNGYPGISTSHTRTLPMESHERDMVGPAPLPPPPPLPPLHAGPQAGRRGTTPTPTPPLRPPSAEYRESNGRHN